MSGLEISKPRGAAAGGEMVFYPVPEAERVQGRNVGPNGDAVKSSLAGIESRLARKRNLSSNLFFRNEISGGLPEVVFRRPGIPVISSNRQATLSKTPFRNPVRFLATFK